jgi:hypothetical protein
MAPKTLDTALTRPRDSRRGSGVGCTLLRAAGQLMRSRGATTMQLEVLVPKGGAHHEKDRLRRWYIRHG